MSYLKYLSDDELRSMTYEEIYKVWDRLLNRSDFHRHELYGERLIYYMQLKRIQNPAQRD